MKVALEILLQSQENQYLEFKSCYDQKKGRPPRPRRLKEIAKDLAICIAEFANADGGTLLLGVENNGTILGFPASGLDLKALLQITSDSWKIPVPHSVEKKEHGGESIIVFEVDPQPLVYSLTDGRTPYRNGTNTVWLSTEEIRAIKKSRTSTLVERSIVEGAKVGELDQDLLTRFQKAVGASANVQIEELLEKHDLAIRHGNECKLTLAACILFGAPPMIKFHERCGINFRRFEGTEAFSGAKNNERIERNVEAPIPFLIEQTFLLLQTQIGVSRKLRDLFFEERPEYPTFAWQEAVVNAIAHRDYSLRGNETEIMMFDDRIEVKSPGLPPDPITIEELQQRLPVHASRNPRIVRVLKALGFVRERGEGLPRMFQETEESFLPSPELKAEGKFFKVFLRNTVIFDDSTMSWLRTFPLEKMNMRQRRILAHSYQSGKKYFILREYAAINHIAKEFAKKEIRELLDLGVLEVVGTRKAAKYFPLIQRGTIEEKLRDFFARRSYLTNSDYRKLVGHMHIVTASLQLKKLVEDGILHKEGSGRGRKYYPAGILLKTK